MDAQFHIDTLDKTLADIARLRDTDETLELHTRAIYAIGVAVRRMLVEQIEYQQAAAR